MQGSRFWVQIGEIDYQRQFVAARKRLESLGGVVVKAWMDRDDEDEIAEAVYIVDVTDAMAIDFKRQASRLGWTCRLVDHVQIQCRLTDEDRLADRAAFTDATGQVAGRLFVGAV